MRKHRFNSAKRKKRKKKTRIALKIYKFNLKTVSDFFEIYCFWYSLKVSKLLRSFVNCYQLKNTF